MTKNEDGTIRIKDDEIIEYLQNKLGSQVYCDFVTWEGLLDRSREFVIMRVVIPGEYMVEDTFDLENMCIKTDKYDLIKRYMFDTSMLDFLHNPENYTTLAMHGIHGIRRDDLIRHSKLMYNECNNIFMVYLKPDKIIFDILSLSRQYDCMTIKEVLHCNSSKLTFTVSVDHKKPNMDCSNVLQNIMLLRKSVKTDMNKFDTDSEAYKTLKDISDKLKVIINTGGATL